MGGVLCRCGAYSSLFEKAELVDVERIPLIPTWQNGQTGVDRIAKCLDKFLIIISLIDKMEKYRSWLDSNRFLDHYPIIYHIEFQGVHDKSPFKFNHGWLKEPGFIDFVDQVWSSFLNHAFSPMELLMKKLILVKGEAINWERYKSIFAKKGLHSIEKEIVHINEKASSGNFLEMELAALIKIEQEK